MTAWNELRRFLGLKRNKLTDLSIDRIMRHAQEEGIIIISTCRNVVVPLTDEDNYDFDSWQSLFNDYVNFCQRKNLNICEERIPTNLDLKEMESLISKKWYIINKESEKKFLEERNKECDNDIYSYLRSIKNPYNFTAIYGGYLEENGNIGENEPSFIVFNNINISKDDRFYNPGWNDLYERALNMCKEYKQDAVYIQAPGKNPVFVDKDGNRINTLKGYEFLNVEDSFFSYNNKINPFLKERLNIHSLDNELSFKELGKSMSTRSRDPGSIFNKMLAKSTGEIWNLESF